MRNTCVKKLMSVLKNVSCELRDLLNDALNVAKRTLMYLVRRQKIEFRGRHERLHLLSSSHIFSDLALLFDGISWDGIIALVRAKEKREKRVSQKRKGS